LGDVCAYEIRFKSLLSTNPITLTACSILLVLGLFVLRVSIFDLIELKTYDLRFLTRGPMSPSTMVVIAAIDEKNLDSKLLLTTMKVSVSGQ